MQRPAYIRPLRRQASLGEGLNGKTAKLLASEDTESNIKYNLLTRKESKIEQKITLKHELDEMMNIAVWLDQQLKVQMEQEITALRMNQKRFLRILKERDKKIEELQKENTLLKDQLDHTKVDKDVLINRLNCEREFSQIMLNIDEEDAELQSLGILKAPKDESITIQNGSLIK